MDAAIDGGNSSAGPEGGGAQTPEAPAESGRLSLPRDLPLVPSLVAAFRQATDYALAMTATVATDPTTAVHEYRKATRRARSVLRMLRPAVPKVARQALDEELGELGRATSLLRDADVLVELCDALGFEGPAGQALAQVRAQLEAHRQALADAGRAAAILTEGAEHLPRLADLLEEVVDVEAPASALTAAFERTWERARAARERALDLRTDEVTHDWRKRVKELRYQLEMLAEPEGGPVEGLRQVYAALAKRLGDITDTIALRRYLATHAEGLSPEQSAALDEALEARIDTERRLAADPLVEVRDCLEALATYHEPAAEATPAV